MKSLEDMSVPELVAEARSSREKASLFEALISDPATRKQALALVKTKNPTMPIPEVDTDIAIEASLATEREKYAKLEETVRNADIRDRLDRERARVMKEHKLTEDELAEVEKLMADEKEPINSYNVAAKLYKAQRVLATPTSSSIAPPVYEMPPAEIWKSGIGNKAALDKAAIKQAYIAMNEFRSGKVA